MVAVLGVGLVVEAGVIRSYPTESTDQVSINVKMM